MLSMLELLKLVAACLFVTPSGLRILFWREVCQNGVFVSMCEKSLYKKDVTSPASAEGASGENLCNFGIAVSKIELGWTYNSVLRKKPTSNRENPVLQKKPYAVISPSTMKSDTIPTNLVLANTKSVNE